MKNIYLDYNATTPMLPCVKEAIGEVMDWLGNPSSVHSHGRWVRSRIEKERETISTFLKCHPNQIVFTSGATESNNMVVHGFNGKILVQATSHESILRVKEDAVLLPVDENGLIDLNALEQQLMLFKSQQKLVSVLAVNNETGVIQPLDDIFTLCKKHEAFIHIDASQVLGKCRFDWKKYSADWISLSSHKCGGPSGIGVLVANPHVPLSPLLVGGGQERSLRAGTENFLGIVGFGAAFKDVFSKSIPLSWSTWQEKIEKTLKQICPELEVFGGSVPRSPQTINLSMPGVHSSTQVINFDLEGFSVSSGAACSSGKVKDSHVLKAMKVNAKHANTSLRISFGWQTTKDDIDSFIGVWQKIYQKCSAPHSSSSRGQKARVGDPENLLDSRVKPENDEGGGGNDGRGSCTHVKQFSKEI